MRDPYKPISKYYDSLSFIYSLGRIPRCRNAFIAEISNSIRSADQEIVTVCFAGAGHCAEAIILAKAGATVTVVDISTSMLDMFQRKLNRVSDEVKERLKIVHDDIRNVKEEFDWVVANFFLNVFPESEMLEILNILVEKCHSHGNLIISDFYYDDEANGLVKILQKMNWDLALSIFCMLVKNSKHPVYDYREYLNENGCNRKKIKKFGFLGLSFYQASQYNQFSDDD